VSSQHPLRAILPGLAFAVALAAAAKGVSLASGGTVSAVLCAIALGILWRNLTEFGAWAEPGLEFAGQTLLRIGIALIGLRLTLLVLADVSLTAVPVVIACIAVALMAAVGLGRLLGVTASIRRLLAAGTAICGCTAIIAIAPLIRAQKADIGIAISCVVLFGSIAMVGYPWLAGVVFGSESLPAGMFFGASIQDTSQVVGAALIYAEQFDAPTTIAVAGLTKFLRTFGLLVLVPAAAMWMARSESMPATDQPRDLRQRAVPWFVMVFLALVVVRTVGDQFAGGFMELWQQLLAWAQRFSELLLLCGMAAVGLGITFSHLREAGWRPLLLSFLAAFLTGACALALLIL